jgi:hypothetical protein
MDDIVETLLSSTQPCVRYNVRVNVLGEKAASPGVRAVRGRIKDSPLARKLLSEVGRDGTIPLHPYSEWRGAHWVLVQLAEIGYPPEDSSLRPLVDQACAWVLRIKPRTVQGRVRRCASQEGNALHYMIRLGLFDQRCDELAERLVCWQWPDGGWNCDKRPDARVSSFHESLIPLRALSAYVAMTGSRKAETAVRNAVELFLARRLLWRRSTGEVIRPGFLKLSYPYYWQYHVLFALKVMAEAGRIGDPRCGDALDLLESKRLDDGGFPTEVRYYCVPRDAPKKRRSGSSLVDWGQARRNRMNPFVTADALAVLTAAGRM